MRSGVRGIVGCDAATVAWPCSGGKSCRQPTCDALISIVLGQFAIVRLDFQHGGQEGDEETMAGAGLLGSNLQLV